MAVQNSFHGRTFGAMALTTSKTYYRQGFAPLMPQVVVAPYPYCLHCKVRQAHPEGDSWYKASPCHLKQLTHVIVCSQTVQAKHAAHAADPTYTS